MAMEPNRTKILQQYFFTGHRKVWSFGFGYGAAQCSLIFMFVAFVLLICDRQSDEIFYKEKEPENGEEEENEESEES